MTRSRPLPRRLAAARRALAWGALVAAVALAPSCSGPQGPANVVLITLDTTRQDDLEIYGGAARTPALAGLAADGVVLENVYSVAYGTTPSHASLFTSLYPRQHGVYDNRTLVPDEAETLAELLRGAGYATAGFVSAAVVGDHLNFGQGFDLLDDVTRQRSGGETAARALDWIDPKRQPFLLWVHFYDPHQPYDPPPGAAARHLAPLAGEPPPAGAEAVDFTQLVYPGPFLEAGREVFEWVERRARARYLAEIEFMDAQIGALLDHLRRQGLYEGSLIAVISDHGENFGDPDPSVAFFHGGLHQGVTRVVALLKLPGSEHSGARRDCLLGSVDFAPTLVDALGLAVPSGWHGVSGLPCVRGEAREARDYLVLEGAHRHEWSVRTRRWVYREPRGDARAKKLMTRNGYAEGEVAKLHDLRLDPQERDNLLRSAEPEGVRERFQALLAEFEKGAGAAASKVLDDPEHLEALKALGYVD